VALYRRRCHFQPLPRQQPDYRQQHIPRRATITTVAPRCWSCIPSPPQEPSSGSTTWARAEYPILSTPITASTRWLGLNAEYRYTDRWLENNLIRTGTTNSKDLNTLDDHMNTGTFGIRPSSLTPAAVRQRGHNHWPGQTARDAHQPRPFPQHPGARDYRVQKRIRFGATYRQMYNLNAPVGYTFTLNAAYGPPPPAYYASHSRDFQSLPHSL